MNFRGVLDYKLVILFITCFIIYLIPVLLGGQIPQTPDEAVYVNGAKHWSSLFSEPATLNLEYQSSQFALPFQIIIGDKGVLIGKYPPGMYIWLTILLIRYL